MTLEHTVCHVCLWISTVEIIIKFGIKFCHVLYKDVVYKLCDFCEKKPLYLSVSI